jgi:hypothetical protein
MHRDAQNPHTRSTNDTRVRKKLRAWMSEILDVMYILEHLPENQLNDLIIDEDVRDLRFIALMATSIKKIGPIVGKLEEPEKWKTVETTTPKRSETWKKFSPIERPVEDRDIVRAVESIADLLWLNTFANATILAPLKGGNPIEKAMHYSRFYSIPALSQRLTEGERKGIERINQALKKYDYNELTDMNLAGFGI